MAKLTNKVGWISWALKNIKMKITCPLCQKKNIPLEDFTNRLPPEYLQQISGIFFPKRGKKKSHKSKKMSEEERKHRIEITIPKESKDDINDMSVNNSGPECYICSQSIHLKPSIMIMSCNHEFHTECIAKERARKCPQCYLELEKDDILNIDKDYCKIYCVEQEEELGTAQNIGEAKDITHYFDQNKQFGMDNASQFGTQYHKINNLRNKEIKEKEEIKENLGFDILCKCGNCIQYNQYNKCKCHGYCDKCLIKYIYIYIYKYIYIYI